MFRRGFFFLTLGVRNMDPAVSQERHPSKERPASTQPLGSAVGPPSHLQVHQLYYRANTQSCLPAFGGVRFVRLRSLCHLCMDFPCPQAHGTVTTAHCVCPLHYITPQFRTCCPMLPCHQTAPSSGQRTPRMQHNPLLASLWWCHRDAANACNHLSTVATCVPMMT